MNISTVWHWKWEMTWIQLSSSTTEVEEVPASIHDPVEDIFAKATAGASPGMM